MGRSIKNLQCFFKNQAGYLFRLFLFFVLPLVLFFQFSIYPLPKIQYVFLGGLFLFQYAFYNEKQYRAKVEPSIVQFLRKELGRTPSKSEIVAGVNFDVTCRGISVSLAGMAILLIMIYFKQY